MNDTPVLLVPMRVDALVLTSPRSVAASFADFSRAPHRGEFGDQNGDVPFISEEFVGHPFEVAPASPFGDRQSVLGRGVHLHWALPDALHTASVRTQVLEASIYGDDIRQLNALQIPDRLSGQLRSSGLKAETQRLSAMDAPDTWRIVDRETGRIHEIRISGEQPRLVRVWRLETRFPPVPTRWLVTRRRGAEIDGQWVVESDHLALDAHGDGVSFPHPDPPFQPCRLGRARPRQAWESSPSGARLRELTAIGFGDPNFATLYPNCRSVFGFHDADLVLDEERRRGDVSYDVIGWWPNPQQEPQCEPRFQEAMRRLRGATASRSGGETAVEAELAIWREAFRQAFGWVVSGEEAAHQARAVCFGRVCVACDRYDADDPWGRGGTHGRVVVAVGATGTEAMSAYLADLHVQGGGLSRQSGDVDSLEGKAMTEERLEAIHLVDQLRDASADVHSSFREARHEQGFTAVDGGVLWSVSDAAEDGGGAKEDARPKTTREMPRLDVLLDALNRAQSDLDALKGEIETRRRLLFSEWSKYLASAHPAPDQIESGPDPNLVRAYIEAGALRELSGEGSLVTMAAAAERRRDSALADLRSAIEAWRTGARVEALPAPRYWRPNEPVLLVAGDAATNTPRHGEDGELPCALDRIAAATIEQGLDELVEVVRRRLDRSKPGDPGFVHCCEPPWNPILLEWEVGFASTIDGSRARRSKGGDYPPDAVSSLYAMTSRSADLELRRSGALPSSGPARPYSGRSILTAHAALQLRRRLEAMVVEILLPAYRRDPANANVDEGNDTDEELFRRLARWQASKGIATAPPAARFLLARHAELYGVNARREPRVLSQALSGFNDALLMQRQTLQAPVDDPIGFEDARGFAAAVRAAVDGRNEVAPQPWRPFHPIRAGLLEIRRLRLVDTFGRTQDLTIDRVTRAETFALAEPGESDPSVIHLRPRLVQPARLSFRLLAAETRAASRNSEASAASRSSPVCGWIALNRLDRDLSLYAADGRALGWLRETGDESRPLVWSSAPGADGLSVGELPPPLRELTERWTGPDGLPLFQNLETHLDAIHPASAGPSPSALLAGRPLALIRARIALELKGPPAPDQSYDALERAIERWLDSGGAPKPPSSDAFPSVAFPVRLGAFSRLEDGVVAWWPEERDPSGRTRLGAARFAADEDVLELSLAEKSRSVLMLVDPRAAIHLTSGLLPTKTIAIPPEHYAPALARLALWFRVGPILSPASRATAPLPEAPGFAWSWVETLGGARIETDAPAPPRRDARWDDEVELIEGWLRLTPATREETE